MKSPVVNSSITLSWFGCPDTLLAYCGGEKLLANLVSKTLDIDIDPRKIGPEDLFFCLAQDLNAGNVRFREPEDRDPDALPVVIAVFPVDGEDEWMELQVPRSPLESSNPAPSEAYSQSGFPVPYCFVRENLGGDIIFTEALRAYLIQHAYGDTDGR